MVEQAFVRAKAGDEDGALADFERSTRVVPSHEPPYHQLDYYLTRRGRSPRVIELWTRYLPAVPDAANACLERGGVYYHLKDFAHARENAQKACSLGLAEGCTRAKQVPGPP